MPLIRYLFLVGSVLAAIIYVVGDTETAATAPANRGWTALDTLRAMAHHGEPAQRAVSLVYNKAAEPADEVAITLAAPQAAVQSNTQSPPAIANAQARVKPKQAARENFPRKNRRQATVQRAVRSRTTVADADRPPSFDLFGSQW